ncbi:MAG: hypothetical protein GY835_20000 [bacterium]|nr:hypothetical protein [bacterium]
MNKPTNIISAFDLEDFTTSSLEQNIKRIQQQPGYGTLERKIREEAYREGAERMRETMTSERKLMTEGPLNQVGALLKDLGDHRNEILQKNSEEIVHLACAIAARIVRVKCIDNQDVIAEKLKRCLMQMERESSYLIRANETQVESLEYLVEQMGSTILKDAPYRIIADERIPVGSLIVEGDKSKLESICGEELARLEEHLVELVNASREGEASEL